MLWDCDRTPVIARGQWPAVARVFSGVEPFEPRVLELALGRAVRGLAGAARGTRAAE